MESLVPTPDVFNSKTAECNADGILAYATWKNIALINVKVTPPVFMDFLEHRIRVSGLSFSKGRNSSLLVSGCEDGSVHVWDINHTAEPVSSFDSSTKVLAVEWKCNADNIVFSSDERPCILEWNITTHSHRSMKTRSKNYVVTLASCPHDPSLLAAGHKSGDISIIDLPTTNVKYQLRAHNDDITYLAWSPHSGEQQLLSTSKDNSIRVWSVEKSDTLHVYPSVSPAKTGINTLFSAQWHPLDPDLIICSSQNFVGTWNMKSEGKPKLQSYSPKNGIRHSRPVALVDVSKPSKNIVFSVSIDRLIIFWDVEEKRPVYQLSTLGGSVYDLAFSTVAVGRLAVAVGDSNIRVWNVASSTTCPTQSLYVGTRSKVCTVAWHPQRENIIAFGTDDGRVGLIDTNLRKTINTSASLHKTKVYKLSWGPCHLKTTDSERTTLYLYSCGDGPIFIHSFGRDGEEETSDFDELRISAGLKDEGSESSHHTEISWKPDFSCVAVGNNDGCIEIYHGSTFALMARLKAQKKLIQSLQWHPTFTSLSSSPSTMSAWLACASYETTIYVYDLTNVITKPDGDSVMEISNATRELVGHSGRVTALVWSPHLEGRLASASYDCSAQVWDVISGETLANFRDHKARIFSVAWNVLDPDIIFSGGDDMLVLQWRISEQTHTQPPSKGRSRKPKKKKFDSTECLKAVVVTDENDAVIDGGEFQANGECAPEVNGNQNAEVATTTESPAIAEDGDCEQDSPELSTSQPNDAEKPNNKEKNDGTSKQRTGGRMRMKKKTKNMLPVYGTLSKQNKSGELRDCMKLAENFSTTDGNTDFMLNSLVEETDTAHLSFFGNQELVLQWLNVEGAHHREVGNFHIAYELEMWKGNLGAALREAAERGDLNDLLVSLAPSVSHTLWLEMCETYAKQLVQDKAFQHAALYLLACGKVYEAIDVLKSKHCYKDALAIAKARLPSSDPLIKEIICGWSAKLRSDGNHAIAAQWNIALNQPLKAASLLSDGNAEHLKVAAFICSKFGYVSETKEYGLLCLKKSMLERKWGTARQMIDEQQPTMNVYKTLIAVHESVMNHTDILQNGTEQCGITERVFHDYCHGVRAIIWRCYMVREQNFLVHVFHSLMSQGLLPTEQEKLLEEIEAVSLLKEKPGESHLAPNQVMIYASVDLTLFYLTLLTESEEKFAAAAVYLNSLFKNCVSSNYHGLLNNICLLSLPYYIMFNTEDLLVNLQTVGMADQEIINQFFVWLRLRIKEQNLLSPVIFVGESGLESPETLLSTNIIQETKEKVCALTSAESILAYCFMNLLFQLEVLICEKNINAKCYYNLQVESDVVSEISPPKSESDVHGSVEEVPSRANGGTLEDPSAIIEDLLLEAEKKIEFIKAQCFKKEIAENEDSSQEKVPTDKVSETSAVDENQELVNQPSKTASSVDLASDASYPELSDSDCGFRSCIGNQTEILSTESELTVGHFSEESVSDACAFRDVVGSPSSHSRCLHYLKFCFYFIHRMASNICNDNYTLLFYLRKKLKKIQNTLASKAVGHHLCGTSAAMEPHMSDNGESDNVPTHFQGVVGTTDSAGPTLQSDDSSQQLNGHTVPDSAVSCEKVDPEKSQKGVNENENLDVVSMQKACKEITDFLDAVAERNFLFPDVIHATSHILGLCNLIKDRNLCQIIDEKLTEFISEVTSWAVKFDINRSLAFKSCGQPLHIDATGDH